MNAIINSHVVELSKDEVRARFEQNGLNSGRGISSLSVNELFEIYTAVVKQGAGK